MAALLACGQLAHAAYTPYLNDPLTSINPTNWYQNGTLSAGAAGITSATSGALISRLSPSTTPNDYLAQATINLPSGTNGGNHGIMFRATTNAQAPSTGSFYLLELQNPTWTGGACSAGLVLQKSVSGTVTTPTSTDLVSTITYGPAGELVSMSGSSVGESRTYNSMGQLTQLTGLSGVNIKYNYPAAGANNGQIASQQDLVSGETISYT